MKRKALSWLICLVMVMSMIPAFAFAEGTDGSVDTTISESGSTDESNAGNTDESNAGDTDESNAGDTDESNAGNTDESNAGNTDESNAGDTDESNAGNTDESDADNTDGSNVGNTDESNPTATNESDPNAGIDLTSLEEETTGPVEVLTYDELVAAVANGGEIKLIEDIYFSNGYNDGKTIKIATGKNVTIDLNGNTLGQTVVDRGLSVAAIAVRQNATLTIKDTAGGGKISACNTAIQLEGTLYLQSGTIAVDNPSPTDQDPDKGWAYGVWFYKSSADAPTPEFYMTGGAIDISDTMMNAHSDSNYANAVAFGNGAEGADAIYEGSVVNISGGNVEGTIVVGENDDNVSISGGTFSQSESIIEYVAPTLDVDANGTVTTLTEENAVASVNGVNYRTVESAVAAANGGTVTLLKDVTETVNLTSGSATLDLAGKSIDVANGKALIVDGATVTIKDSVGEGSIESGDDQALRVVNGAKVTLDSGNVKTGGYYGVVVFNSGTSFTMNGGSITADWGISGNGSSGYEGTTITINDGTINGTKVGIYHPQDGTLAINGGTISGATGVYVKAGNVTVSDGATIKGTGEKQAYQVSNNGLNSTGDAFVVDNNPSYANLTVNVTGGTFTSENADAVASYAASEQTMVDDFISGGTFSSDVRDLVVPGNSTVESNGIYTLEPSADAVASVNGVGYETLKEAINAAKEGDTVKLLASYEDYWSVQIGKTITIDLNGFNIRRSSGGLAVDVTDGTVTITGQGTISGSVDGISVADDASLIVKEGVTVEGRDGHGIENKGVLTIDGATVKATEYGVAHYEGSMTMNSGSVSGEYGIAAYTDTKVTINGGTVTGTVAGLAGHGEYHGTTFTITDGTIQSENGVGIYHPQKGTLTISGGTISGATGINMKSGTLSVTGGTIKGTGEKADYSFVASGFNTTGDALVIESCNYPGGAPAASITGGTFSSKNADSVASYAGNNVSETVTGFISGGTFSNEVPLAFCAEDFAPVKNADGTYGVLCTHKVTLSNVPEGAAVVVKDADGNVVEAEADGSYILVHGTYSYAVTKEGYVAKNGTFTVEDKDITVDVTMDAIKYFTVTYVIDGKTVYTETVEEGKDVSKIPTIPAKEGYDKVAPYWDKDGKNITADTTIKAVYTQNPVEKWTITFAEVPEGAEIVLKDADGNVIKAEADGTYLLADGEYTYMITKEGYKTFYGTFDVEGYSGPVTPKMEPVVEETDKGDGTTESDKTEETNKTEVEKTDSVSTGDHSPILLMMLVLVVSVQVIAGVVAYNVKRRSMK